MSRPSAYAPCEESEVYGYSTRFQFHLPIVKETATYEGAAWLFEVSKYVIDGGKTKSAFTDLRDIGPFVARIIADPRALNQYVFVWGEEVTQQEIFDIVRSAWGHEIVAVDVSTCSLSTALERYQ